MELINEQIINDTIARFVNNDPNWELITAIGLRNFRERLMIQLDRAELQLKATQLHFEQEYRRLCGAGELNLASLAADRANYELAEISRQLTICRRAIERFDREVKVLSTSAEITALKLAILEHRALTCDPRPQDENLWSVLE